jgi:tryptophan halogenase
MPESSPTDAPSESTGRGTAEPVGIRSIAIVGGGTAGWMAASVLARALTGSGCEIIVVESPDIGTVGVGEATIPPILDLLRFLDINEADFVRHTQATYKLGIRFTNWRRVGHTYWHPFGTFGVPINRRPFHHFWQKARVDGLAPRLQDYSLCAALGDRGRFLFPDASDSGTNSGLRYALHFDAGLVAEYLAAYARRLGVRHLQRTLQGATVDANGRIDELVMTDGSRLKSELYIDCSGFKGVLIEQTLKTGYVNWSDVLPCDRAVVLPTESNGVRPPFTESNALSAGWRWHIPLQSRNGNGYVYSSAHVSDEQALDELLSVVHGKHLAAPRVLRFATGRRRLFWNGNCVALGLASGFLEPLESTSIHFVMRGLFSLLEHFPDCGFSQANIDSYNAELSYECERARDFIVLHYCLTERIDTPLWATCKSMQVPDSLAERIELYAATGRIRPKAAELFTDLSWFYILDGMGVIPRGHDPLTDIVTTQQFREILARLAAATQAAVDSAPSHDSLFVGAPTAAEEALRANAGNRETGYPRFPPSGIEMRR